MKALFETVGPYWKAVVAFFAPGFVAIGGAVLEGSPGGVVITQAEWVQAIVACVVTASLVYAIPNITKPAAKAARVAD